MSWPVYPEGRRARTAVWLIIGTVLTGTGAAFAQLSPEDIERLRKRGQEEGWTFKDHDSHRRVTSGVFSKLLSALGKVVGTP